MKEHNNLSKTLRLSNTRLYNYENNLNICFYQNNTYIRVDKIVKVDGHSTYNSQPKAANLTLLIILSKG